MGLRRSGAQRPGCPIAYWLMPFVSSACDTVAFDVGLQRRTSTACSVPPSSGRLGALCDRAGQVEERLAIDGQALGCESPADQRMPYRSCA